MTAEPRPAARSTRAARSVRSRKPANRYHHGDLRRALFDETLRTIQEGGVDALTLRGVGARLGVSRTALYRHFADKAALLAAVSRDGFRRLEEALRAAWEHEGRGREGFNAMGRAYVRFALEHPAHYRVMFGGFIDKDCVEPAGSPEAASAFQVLVDSLIEQQQLGLVRRDDAPQQQAMFTWALVHGIATLAIDGLLQRDRPGAEALMDYAVSRISTGLG